MSPIEQLRACKGGIPEGVAEFADPAIDAFLSARQIVHNALHDFNDLEDQKGLIYHTLENLLGRLEEQTEGMLTCFVSGCPAAAETVARTVVETSVNLIYMARGDFLKRVFSYFRIYRREHGKRLDEWEAFIKAEHPIDVTRSINSMIQERRKALDSFREFSEKLADSCGFPENPNTADWEPKLFQRFKAIGDSVGYWTVYHRLSGATHGNAEDTIRWLMSKYHILQSGDDKLQTAMALENMAYTAMMLRISVRYYIHAAACTCAVLNLIEAANLLKPIFSGLTNSIDEIADAAGCPRFR